VTSLVMQLRGATKRFPGVTALDRVSIEVRPQEIVGLVGQNGSGKSTLLKVLLGLHALDEGELLLHGEPVHLDGPSDARRRGVGMVFQEQSLLPNLTVAENIALGAETVRVPARGLYRWGAVRSLAQEQMDKIGSSIPISALVSTLSQLERQTVELAKALVAELYAPTNALLLFDEATSTLSQAEIDVLFREIRRLRNDSSVIFVSHRLEEVLEVSDRVYVLRDGVCVAERARGEWEQDELFQLMVGRASASDHFQLERQAAVDDHDVRLRVEGLTKAGAYGDVSFELRSGEVLGICGVEGSGRDKVMRTLFGLERPDAGTIELDGRRVRFSGPEGAVGAGIGYIPADRTAEASLLEMNVRENMTVAHLDNVMSGPLMSATRERRLTERWIDRLGIRTPSLTTPMRSLSGGNQQKVVFARWLLADDIRLLLLDHPTRGLDVGAKAEVYSIIRDTAAAGTAIVLLSDSLEETVALSHAILVMKDGQITGRMPAPVGGKPDQVSIVEKML
jgi:ribose transport system ATP-binding protein